MDADIATKTLCLDGDSLFSVRVAYQTPIQVTAPGSTSQETAYPYTFEDALAFENLAFFSTLEGAGLVRKFRDGIAVGGSVAAIGERLYLALKSGKKAEFALDVLEVERFDNIVVPRYIAQGLEWLLEQLRKKQIEILPQGERVDPSEHVQQAAA